MVHIGVQFVRYDNDVAGSVYYTVNVQVIKPVYALLFSRVSPFSQIDVIRAMSNLNLKPPVTLYGLQDLKRCINTMLLYYYYYYCLKVRRQCR